MWELLLGKIYKKHFVQRWIVSAKQVYEGSTFKLMCPNKLLKIKNILANDIDQNCFFFTLHPPNKNKIVKADFSVWNYQKRMILKSFLIWVKKTKNSNIFPWHHYIKSKWNSGHDRPWDFFLEFLNYNIKSIMPVKAQQNAYIGYGLSAGW